MPKLEVEPISKHVARHRTQFDPYYSGEKVESDKKAKPNKKVKLDAAQTARDTGKLDWNTVQRYKLLGIKLPDEVLEEADAQARGEELYEDEDEH